MASEKEYVEYILGVKGQEKLQELGDIVEELMQKTKESGINVDEFAEKLKKLGNVPKNDLPIYDQFISKMKTIASITAVGVGIKKSIDLFTSFDDIARKVQATTGANAETMELLRFQAKELGDTTSWSASEATEAQFEFAKAGFTNNEILAATPGILNTATASQLGLAQATEITSGVLRTFKLNANESNTVGDMLAKTASSTSTDVQGLGEALKYAGVDSRNFGMNLQQTLGVLGKMGNEMLKDSSAGTSLQAVFNSLQNQSKAKILIDAGINLTQDGKYRNFLDILKDIKAKTLEMQEAQAKSFITNVFGEQGSQAMKRLLAVPTNELNILISEIENSKGYAQELANTLNGGVGGAFRNLKSATEGFGISIGSYLEPSVISLINGVTEIVKVGIGFIDWLNSGSYMADVMSFAIVSLGTGFLAYKTYLIGVIAWEKMHNLELLKKISVTGIMNAVTGLAIAGHTAYMAVLGILTGQISIATGVTWAFNTAIGVLSGPIGLIIAGVVGVGAGFVFLYKKSQRFRETIDPLINKLKSLWEWIKKFTFVGDAINVAKAGIGKITNFFKFGSQKNSKEENQKAIDDKTKQLLAGTGEIPEFSSGAGENTDYLITGGQSSGKPIHNGYYLKGTKNLSSTSSNIYTNNSTENKVIEKSPEEKIVELLTSIKELLSSKKSKDSNIQINISKENNEDIISQVVEDLTIALGNI